MNYTYRYRNEIHCPFTGYRYQYYLLQIPSTMYGTVKSVRLTIFNQRGF
jgi:hypothetical protein